MKNIVLTGFMATGKTSVGRLLSSELGLRFVDLDELIEKEAGLRVAGIFEKLGEDRFRAMERDIVGKLCSGAYGQGLVVATGGGAVKDPGNRELLKGWGTIICLIASVDEIIERVGSKTDRPLLSGRDRRERIEGLLEQRQEAYRDCHFSIDTTGLNVAQVAEAIKEFLNRG